MPNYRIPAQEAQICLYPSALATDIPTQHPVVLVRIERSLFTLRLLPRIVDRMKRYWPGGWHLTIQEGSGTSLQWKAGDLAPHTHRCLINCKINCLTIFTEKIQSSLPPHLDPLQIISTDISIRVSSGRSACVFVDEDVTLMEI